MISYITLTLFTSTHTNTKSSLQGRHLPRMALAMAWTMQCEIEQLVLYTMYNTQYNACYICIPFSVGLHTIFFSRAFGSISLGLVLHLIPHNDIFFLHLLLHLLHADYMQKCRARWVENHKHPKFANVRSNHSFSFLITRIQSICHSVLLSQSHPLPADNQIQPGTLV